jgi:general L-amino acid transport system permease protein
MIRERWHQFLFGFYPPDLYWRPGDGLRPAVRRPGAGAVFGQRNLRHRRRAILMIVALLVLTLVAIRLPAQMAFTVLVGPWLLALAYASPATAVVHAALSGDGFWLLWGGSIWGPSWRWPVRDHGYWCSVSSSDQA